MVKITDQPETAGDGAEARGGGVLSHQDGFPAETPVPPSPAHGEKEVEGDGQRGRCALRP